MAVSFEQLKSDMDEKCEMLTDAQILALANKVNAVINLPILSEEKELIVFCKLIRKVDQAIYQLLPNEYYDMVHNASDGISASDAERMRKRLVPLINKAVDIPFLTEEMEAFVIDLILKVIVDALVKGCKLNEK